MVRLMFCIVRRFPIEKRFPIKKSIKKYSPPSETLKGHAGHQATIDHLPVCVYSTL